MLTLQSGDGEGEATRAKERRTGEGARTSNDQEGLDQGRPVATVDRKILQAGRMALAGPVRSVAHILVARQITAGGSMDAVDVGFAEMRLVADRHF